MPSNWLFIAVLNCTIAPGEPEVLQSCPPLQLPPTAMPPALPNARLLSTCTSLLLTTCTPRLALPQTTLLRSTAPSEWSSTRTPSSVAPVTWKPSITASHSSVRLMPSSPALDTPVNGSTQCPASMNTVPPG